MTTRLQLNGSLLLQQIHMFNLDIQIGRIGNIFASLRSS